MTPFRSPLVQGALTWVIQSGQTKTSQSNKKVHIWGKTLTTASNLESYLMGKWIDLWDYF